MQGNFIFTDSDGNILPEDDEEDKDYDPDKEDQEYTSLVLPNDPNYLDNKLNDIAGVDYIPEDTEEKKQFILQDPDNTPAKEYESEKK